MGRIGIGEVIVVGLVIILLFGARRLPEIGSAIGQAIREFKKAAQKSDDNISDNDKKS